MKDNKVERVRRGAAMLRRQFLQGDDGVFDRVLGDREMATVMSESVKPYRERIYSPLDTLRLFVGQVLSADRACQDVVGRRLSERIAQGQSESALNTGSYCDARQRLPVALPMMLGAKIGERLESIELKGPGTNGTYLRGMQHRRMNGKAGSMGVRWSCETTIHHPRSRPKCIVNPKRVCGNNVGFNNRFASRRERVTPTHSLIY